MEWGGSLNQAAVQTQTDTARALSLDQQYSAYFTDLLVPSVQYYAGLRYRHLQSHPEGLPVSWQTELNPDLNAVWTAPFFNLRAAYGYRDIRSRDGQANTIGRSASGDFQTNWRSLPRVELHYGYDQNVNDLDLIGLDTRQTSLSAALDYQWKTAHARYEYGENDARNRTTGVEQHARYHTGRMESSVGLFDRAVTLRSSYRLTARRDREQRTAGQEILVALNPLAGLFSVDPTPDYDALELFPGLVDGNLDSAASRQMNLSASTVQNFGLDFGAPTELDRVYLYTDTLANASLLWAVYTSDDNLTWTLVQDNQTFPFQVFFRRFEIQFPVQTTRYIKVVCQPIPAETEVLVTELRAIITRQEQVEAAWSTNHQASVNLGIQPLSWLSGSFEGSLNRQEKTPTEQAREQDGLMGSLRIAPSRLLGISAQYHFGRTGYPGQSLNRTDNDMLGVSATSQWLPGLRTTFAVTRRREFVQDRQDRRLDGLNARLESRFLPRLGGTTEAGWSVDHRFVASDQFETRFAGQTLDAEPTAQSQISASYRFYDLDSRRALGPKFRESVGLSLGYRVTTSLYTRASLTGSRETGRTYTNWDGVVSWSLTPRLDLSGSVERVLQDRNSTTLYNSQIAYRWSRRGDVSANLSKLRYDDAPRNNVTTLRLSFSLYL